MTTRSGPPPKDPKMRRRRNKDLVETMELSSAPGPVKATPSVDHTWHPIVRQLFMSYSSSPQAMYFEPSDWAQLKYVCEFISSMLYKGEYEADFPDQYRLNLDSAASAISSLEDFLTTEATRRRLRISIDPGKTLWTE
ncbi:phage terminase small subunit, partial [Streptomyces sp. NPDC055254]